MIKALLVVSLLSGTEYAVDMPNMNTCLSQAKIVEAQGKDVDVLCIPKADNSAKMREVFSMFGEMMNRMQESELGSPYQQR